MVDEVEEYLKHLQDIGNPLYFSILLTITLFVFIIFVYKYIIAPLIKKHLLEKKELELKNIKLMALFAELDPNPLIRIDAGSTIIHTNEAIKEISSNKSIEGKNISEIIPSLNFSVKELIENDRSVTLNETINKKYYSIVIRGISYLNIAQIYFDDLTDRKIFEEELRESRSKLRELSEHLRDTLEDERQRIARELHDSIGQNLNLIRMKLQNNNSPEEKILSKTDYQTLLNSVEISLNELKEIIYDLKPKILEEMGLGLSLKTLAGKIAAETGMKGTTDIYGEKERFDRKLELTLYRITQEALNNIVKHSGANEFNIQLMNKKNSIGLLISDDGSGFDFNHIYNPGNKSGFGLINMQERVKTFNGTLKIDSSKGSGTVIIVEIPKGKKNE
jgi:signal transduction histidine kinase